MRVFKVLSALFAVTACAAFVASTASAELILWRLLPGAAGTTISGSSEKATLQIKGSGTITCTSSATEKGELQESQTLGLIIVVFKGCKAFGLSAETEGAGKETIIVHVELHTCLIALNDYGIIFKVLPVIILIPSTKLTIEVKGSFVGLISPGEAEAKTGPFTLLIAQKEGKQEIEKCEGGEALTLESKVDASKTFTPSAEEAAGGTVTFSAAQVIMV